MPFRRKWVSDTNLSKLLHETMEKKEANKQRRSPDFCKDAILSATIKKISSAMHMKAMAFPLDSQENHEQYIEDSEPCDDGVEFMTACSDWNPGLENGGNHIINTENTFDSDSGSDDFELSLEDRESLSFNDTMDCKVKCISPKRKRPASLLQQARECSNEKEIIAPHASPSKRRRKSENINHSSCFSFKKEMTSGIYRKNSKHVDGSLSDDDSHLKTKDLISLQPLNKSDYVHSSYETTYSPVRSMVSSISELSIRDCWKPNRNGSWCQRDIPDSDPLELNVFFQELKSITSSTS